MKRKFLKIFSALLVSAMVFTACSGNNQAKDTGAKDEKDTKKTEQAEKVATPQVNRIVVNSSGDPGTLDPAKAQGTHESFPLQHMFVGLTRIDKDGKVENALADKIDVSKDGKTYTITLKDGLKWSDNNPLTANDFEFSWKRALDPETKSEYAYQLYYIKNGQKYNEGKAKADDVAVKAKDDKTLVVELEQPTAYFPSLLSFYTFYPVEKAVVEKNPDWAKDSNTFVSNGPFVLKLWKHNAIINMDKNPNFYDAQNVKIDGIDMYITEDQTTAYQKYQAGELNVDTELPTNVVGQLKEQNSKELIIGPQASVYYYNLNPNKKPLNNVKARRALSLAIDRQTIVDKITKGGQRTATGVVPDGFVDDEGKDFSQANTEFFEPTSNKEEAKKLFEEALKEENMKPEDVKLTILYNTNENHKLIAQAIQNMWKNALGIDVGIENTEFKVKLDREKKGDYDISRAGWSADYLDPMTFMDLWVTGGSFNDAKFSNPEYDKLVEEAKASSDPKVRMDNMKKAEKILLENMPVIPVYFYTRPYLVKPNVTGVYKVATQEPILTYAQVKLD